MTARKVCLTEEIMPSGHSLVHARLSAPRRNNALEPIILSQLCDAIDRAADCGAVIVTLSAEGRHFSTGGDVAAFARASNDADPVGYSNEVVGKLQRAIVGLLRLPAVVVTAAQGAITGGSAGLLFASDFVILSDDAFIQPYFAEVGFGPDGGWTALLPERIGAGRALQWQLTNHRMTAKQAIDAGLAARAVATAELDEVLAETVADLDRRNVAGAMVAAKRLLWNEPRITRVEQGCGEELRTFCERIVAPETRTGMERFLQAL